MHLLEFHILALHKQLPFHDLFMIAPRVVVTDSCR